MEVEYNCVGKDSTEIEVVIDTADKPVLSQSWREISMVVNSIMLFSSHNFQ